MADKAKGPALLADREGLGNVSLCGCGVVSVNLGAFTLRMESEAFAQLEEMLREASAELYAREMAVGMTTAGSLMTH